MRGKEGVRKRRMRKRRVQTEGRERFKNGYESLGLLRHKDETAGEKKC